MTDDDLPAYCTCADEAADEHTCPYREDINGDYDSLCTCCAFCEEQCTQGV